MPSSLPSSLRPTLVRSSSHGCAGTSSYAATYAYLSLVFWRSFVVIALLLSLSLSLAWRNGRHLESCHCSWSHTLAHATAGSLGVDCAKRTRRTIDTRTLARIASPRSLERRSLACSLARYALSLPSPRVPPSAHRGEYHRRASCHLSSRVDDCLLNSTRALSLSLSSLIRSMATACRKQAHIFASLSLSIPCAIQLSRASASLCLTLCLSSSD